MSFLHKENLLDLRAAQKPRVVGEGSALIASIGKVGHGRSDSVEESNVDNIDVGIYMQVSDLKCFFFSILAAVLGYESRNVPLQ